MRSDFPDVVDSTMRAAYVACPMKFYYEYIQQIAPQGSNRDLIAGGAFAAGVCETRRAFYERGLDVELSLAYGLQAIIREWKGDDLFDDYVKSQSRIIRALEYYFTQYPLPTDVVKPFHLGGGKCAIESSFALPIPDTSHPRTGDPILYAGRYDMLGVREGVLFIVDEKTTKQLGPSWANNWTLRSQFTGYVWGAQQFGHPVAGAIIRGISFLKERNDTQQVIVYRPAWQIERWVEQLSRDVNRMISDWNADRWDYNLDASCSHYGGCPFMKLCDNSNPEALIDLYYEERKWDPLRRDQ